MLRRLAQPGTLHARLRPPPLLRLRPTVPAFASGCRRARSTLSSATGAASASAAGPEIASAAPLRRWLTATKVPLLNLSISDLFGHAAFALAGTAFLDPDILNLRLLSVASGGATLVFTFFHPVGRPLWLPFGWNCLFMLINSATSTGSSSSSARPTTCPRRLGLELGLGLGLGLGRGRPPAPAG